MSMGNHLASLLSGLAKAKTENNVIKAGFKEHNHIIARYALHTLSLVIHLRDCFSRYRKRISSSAFR
jgi:hypothetical protein